MLKVRKAYERLSNSTPDYISSLASPMRKRRQDELIANHQVMISIKHFRGNLYALHDRLVCTQFGHIILGYIMPKMNMFTSHS